MSILRLKKCAIIAVNTIMSIWLIRAILFPATWVTSHRHFSNLTPTEVNAYTDRSERPKQLFCVSNSSGFVRE